MYEIRNYAFPYVSSDSRMTPLVNNERNVQSLTKDGRQEPCRYGIEILMKYMIKNESGFETEISCLSDHRNEMMTSKRCIGRVVHIFLLCL